ncbi:ketopantoate reductase family protein [Papillibacter cinnamivorans]|uniref:2-dehydropantoate 2-reductase n=1 Tax=Papillibacter cinnamivorans DSM 12816 TaxID=1122930 RepID=A0A1W2C9U4_9FIRM|nr:2-dehydropantoate 2-reductase [Papillibacter cinnamivorans]SMC81919.1 2-dehydropantoate 2-reductase [Papillibacter cinnamivorans DSM 12816]
MEIKRAALVGMGAIGSVYAKYLTDRYGEDFAVAADSNRGKRLRSEGIVLNGERFVPRVVFPETDRFQADLVIFCVKNGQLEEAMEEVRPFIGPETVLLPLLNGITARDRLLAGYPDNLVLYGLAIHIVSVREGSRVISTSLGTIQFGEAENKDPSPRVLSVQRFLEGAGLEAKIMPDMRWAVWRKWMLNVGANQVSAVSGAGYGNLLGLPELRSLFRDAMAEVAALAQAEGIDLGEREMEEFLTTMQRHNPLGKTSMLQDVEAGRKTEVEYFSGTVMELGARHGIPTPVNRVLYRLIRAREQMY